MDPTFDFERLEVYQLSRELNREVAALLKDLPRGAGESADNLRRAARSITRNIAEACGKWTIPDKINRFQIARGSASECGAASMSSSITVSRRRIESPERELSRGGLCRR